MWDIVIDIECDQYHSLISISQVAKFIKNLVIVHFNYFWNFRVFSG
jgi:hypothetical protein